MLEIDQNELFKDLKMLNPNLKNYVFMPINYIEEINPIDFFQEGFTSGDIPFLYSLGIKRKEWKYENEWRLVSYSDGYGIPNSLIDSSLKDQDGVVPRNINYPKSCIKSITLGKQFFNKWNSKKIEEGKYQIIEEKKLEIYLLQQYSDKLFMCFDEILDGVLTRVTYKLNVNNIGNNLYEIMADQRVA